MRSEVVFGEKLCGESESIACISDFLVYGTKAHCRWAQQGF